MLGTPDPPPKPPAGLYGAPGVGLDLSGGGLTRSGVDPPLCPSRACLHKAPPQLLSRVDRISRMGDAGGTVRHPRSLPPGFWSRVSDTPPPNECG